MPPKLEKGKRAPFPKFTLGRRTIAILLLRLPSKVVYPCTRRRCCAYLHSLGCLLALGRPLLQQTTTGTPANRRNLLTGILMFLAPPDRASIPFLLGTRFLGKGMPAFGLQVMTVWTPSARGSASYLIFLFRERAMKIVGFTSLNSVVHVPVQILRLGGLRAGATRWKHRPRVLPLWSNRMFLKQLG